MNEVVTANAGARATRIAARVPGRLARMRFLSRLMDNSILLPGGYRIGLDPLIGLVPAAGDFVAATLSIWLIYDAARLGVSKRTLARMAANVLVETVVGTVPLLGDVFDAVWKANAKNVSLVEAEYSPALKERPFRRIALGLFALLLGIWGVLFLSIYLLVQGFIAIFK
jgi:hypothetical protein